MIRQARKLWRRRRTIRGEHFDVTIRRWWSPKSRRAARLSLHMLDASYGRYAREIRREFARVMLHGEAYAQAGFHADEWPYREPPPDPL